MSDGSKLKWGMGHILYHLPSVELSGKHTYPLTILLAFLIKSYLSMFEIQPRREKEREREREGERNRAH